MTDTSVYRIDTWRAGMSFSITVVDLSTNDHETEDATYPTTEHEVRERLTTRLRSRQ